MVRKNVYYALMRTQGITPQAQDTSDALLAGGRHSYTKAKIAPDCGVAKARSAVASAFMRSDAEIMLMQDHDIEVPDIEHIDYLIDQAAEFGVVGALVSKRAPNQQYTSRLMDDCDHQVGSDEIVELQKHIGYMGAGLFVVHRSVLQAIIDRGIVPHCPLQNMWPFFCTMWIHNPVIGCTEFLTEDWSFNVYVRAAGRATHVAMRPKVYHHGRWRFGQDGNIHQPTLEEAIANAAPRCDA